MKKILIMYMPVLHQGYLQLIKCVSPDKIYLVGDELLEDVPGELDYVRRKDRIRAVPARDMRRFLGRYIDVPFDPVLDPSFVDVAHKPALSVCERVRERGVAKIVMPDEDLSHWLAETYFHGNVEYEKVFLRFDRTAVEAKETAESTANIVASLDTLDRVFMREAMNEAERSVDWWRHIGAVLVKDNRVILAAHNTHVPCPDAPNIYGDPRSLFKRGIRIECSSAEHAEAHVIAEAAKCGISTRGADLYVTAFPCPQCAILIAHAGIARCFFASGYSVLHGEDVLRDKGVELIYVDMNAPHE